VNSAQKLLIDVEGKSGIPGYYIKSELEVVSAGKNIMSIPENERNLKIYKLLEENCDMIFCTTQKLEDFNFYPVPSFWIFAIDHEGNCFGTIGDMGGIEDNNCPVGYVSVDGTYGKVANNLKEFLELITFYLHWRGIIEYEKAGKFHDINDISMRKLKDDLQYLEYQSEIAEILKLSKNPRSIELLISNITGESKFIVYDSKEAAGMENKFFDTNCLD